MAYPHTPKLDFPLEEYKVNSYSFKEKCSYGDTYWGVHLGEDINCPAGTEVKSIGRGRVVYSDLHAGSKENKNWGNIIIIAHKNPETKFVFFSLYGHLKKRLVEKGERVKLGQVIGLVGKSGTPENGWWEEEHLHFSIYTGPWDRGVLPGYWKEETSRTKLSYWEKPKEFIENYKV